MCFPSSIFIYLFRYIFQIFPLVLTSIYRSHAMILQCMVLMPNTSCMMPLLVKSLDFDFPAFSLKGEECTTSSVRYALIRKKKERKYYANFSEGVIKETSFTSRRAKPDLAPPDPGISRTKREGFLKPLGKVSSIGRIEPVTSRVVPLV